MTMTHAGLTRGFILCALAALCVPAQAQDAATFGIGVTGGTLGIGPEASVGVGKHLGLRANATFLSINGSYSTSDLDYDARLKLRSAGLMVDLFPWSGGFYVSGGVRSNGNRADLLATPSGNVTIGNTVYTPAQIGTVSGDADVADVAPTATLGYRKRSGGFSFGIEAGALFQGSVRINQFKSSTGLISQADLDAERAELQADVNKYKVYPVLQISLGWRF